MSKIKLHPSIVHINADRPLSDEWIIVINKIAERLFTMSNAELNELTFKRSYKPESSQATQEVKPMASAYAEPGCNCEECSPRV